MKTLKDYESVAVIAFLMNAANEETRRRLAKEMPEIYNQLMGRRAVQAFHLCLGCERIGYICTCGDQGLHAEATQ